MQRKKAKRVYLFMRSINLTKDLSTSSNHNAQQESLFSFISRKTKVANHKPI